MMGKFKVFLLKNSFFSKICILSTKSEHILTLLKHFLQINRNQLHIEFDYIHKNFIINVCL